MKPTRDDNEVAGNKTTTIFGALIGAVAIVPN